MSNVLGAPLGCALERWKQLQPGHGVGGAAALERAELSSEAKPAGVLLTAHNDLIEHVPDGSLAANRSELEECPKPQSHSILVRS